MPGASITLGTVTADLFCPGATTEDTQMTIIDLTAQMAPAGIGGVALLATTVAGIVSCLDERERALLRASAERIGAWWFARGSSSARKVDASRKQATRPAAPEAWPVRPRVSA